MAYPFSQWPRLSEFVDRVKRDFKAVDYLPKGKIIGPHGKADIRGLKVGDNIAILPDDDGKPLVPSVVRSLCDRLGIPAETFGFTLSDWDAISDPPS